MRRYAALSPQRGDKLPAKLKFEYPPMVAKSKTICYNFQ